MISLSADLVGLTYGLPGVPVSAYFQLSMRAWLCYEAGSRDVRARLISHAVRPGGLGFSTVMSNLLSVPYTVLGIIMLLVIVALSELINVRTWVAVYVRLYPLARPFPALGVLNLRLLQLAKRLVSPHLHFPPRAARSDCAVVLLGVGFSRTRGSVRSRSSRCAALLVSPAPKGVGIACSSCV